MLTSKKNRLVDNNNIRTSENPELQKKKIGMGWIGKLLGEGETQSKNISFMALFILFALLFYRIDDLDMRVKIFSTITLILGYIFGISQRK